MAAISTSCSGFLWTLQNRSTEDLNYFLAVTFIYGKGAALAYVPPVSGYNERDDVISKLMWRDLTWPLTDVGDDERTPESNAQGPDHCHDFSQTAAHVCFSWVSLFEKFPYTCDECEEEIATEHMLWMCHGDDQFLLSGKSQTRAHIHTDQRTAAVKYKKQGTWKQTS